MTIWVRFLVTKYVIINWNKYILLFVSDPTVDKITSIDTTLQSLTSVAIEKSFQCFELFSKLVFRDILSSGEITVDSNMHLPWVYLIVPIRAYLLLFFFSFWDTCGWPKCQRCSCWTWSKRNRWCAANLAARTCCWALWSTICCRTRGRILPANRPSNGNPTASCRTYLPSVSIVISYILLNFRVN